MKKNLGKEKKILSGGWEWVLRNIGKYKNKKKGNVMTIFVKQTPTKGMNPIIFLSQCLIPQPNVA